MRKIIPVKLSSRVYLFREITVWLYLLLLQDRDAFFDYIMDEAGCDVIMNPSEEERFMQVYLDTGTKSDLESIFEDKKQWEERDFYTEFLIVAGKYIHATPGENFASISQMPLKLFFDILKNLEYITGKQEYKIGAKKSKQSNTGPDKQALRELFGNAYKRW